jgi:hypothetical protein
MKLVFALVGALLLVGCARYDFQIVQPAPLAQRITQVQTRVNTEHMAYDMVAKENRLVILAFNHTDAPVQLLGDKSFVVDPQGASHPLRSQTIAPKSYAKLILPPLRPRFEQSPQWHFGVGTVIGQGSAPAPSPSPVSTTPRYLDIYEDQDNFYWHWDGQAPIRLSITFQQSDGTVFADQFTIEKVEAK